MADKILRQVGFTLIEMLIVVAMIAILAAIALPNYTDYIRRGNIIEGTAALSAARNNAEHYFGDSVPHVYGDANGQFACPGSTKYFTITCNPVTATTYTVTATGIGTMTGFVYTIDQANNKATTQVPSGWTGAPANCWVIRKGGSC